MYLFHQPLRKKVFYKLLQMFLCYSIMEECHFAIDDSKYGWRAVSTEVIG